MSLVGLSPPTKVPTSNVSQASAIMYVDIPDLVPQTLSITPNVPCA